MKNLKINDKKIKDLLKKGIALITVTSTIVVASGCYKKHENNDLAYIKTVVREELPITLYKGKNIALAINKETYEVKKYILHNEDVSPKIDNLGNNYIVAAGLIITSPSDYNVSSAKIILDDYYVVEFIDIKDYIEGYKLKDYYTLDEIIELESVIVESVKKINEQEKNNQKVKK